MNDELSLLCECISTEGEAEGGGVKFIYMDENTIYRFENNRMKKIGKQLINKAKREITRRNRNPDNEDDESQEVKPKAKKSKQPKKPSKSKREVIPDSDEEDEAPVIEDEEEEPPEPPVKVKAQRVPKPKPSTQRKASQQLPSIDLDEYYDTKHRMEYMTLEINRLNNKVGKLRQYKSIVNKLTGGEIDDLPQQENKQQSQPRGESKIKTANDSLFMF